MISRIIQRPRKRLIVLLVKNKLRHFSNLLWINQKEESAIFYFTLGKNDSQSFLRYRTLILYVQSQAKQYKYKNTNFSTIYQIVPKGRTLWEILTAIGTQKTDYRLGQSMKNNFIKDQKNSEVCHFNFQIRIITV